MNTTTQEWANTETMAPTYTAKLQTAAQLAASIRRYKAACRALSVVQSLPAGEFRARHNKRVMGNLSRARSGMFKAKKAS